MEDRRKMLEKTVYVLRRCGFSWGQHVFFTGIEDWTLLCAAVAKHAGAANIAFWVKSEAEKARAEALGYTAFQGDQENVEEFLSRVTDKYGFHLAVESTGTMEAYEMLLRVLRRGGNAALTKPLPEPFYFHVCDAIRDQIHFVGIQEADERSREISRRLESSDRFSALIKELDRRERGIS